MLTAVSAVAVVAFAPPVGVRVGGLGEGSTPFAVAWPLLVTVIWAWNVWPRLTLAGTVKAVTWSAAGTSTGAVLELSEAALAAAPELASVPAAPEARRSVPVPVPSSVYVQVKVALPPPGMVAGRRVVLVVAEAPPVVVSVGGLGEGSTPEALAWPLLATVMLAVKVCPRES